MWGVWEAFKFWMEGALLGIFKFLSYFLNAIVMFIVISRIMELYVRGSFLPIAASLMSDNGWKGSGGRYFRKLMSLATQSAAIMVVANVFSVVMRSAIGSKWTTFGVQGRFYQFDFQLQKTHLSSWGRGLWLRPLIAAKYEEFKVSEHYKRKRQKKTFHMYAVSTRRNHLYFRITAKAAGSCFFWYCFHQRYF